MKKPEEAYESLMQLKTLEDMAPAKALECLGHFIDIAAKLKKSEGTKHAIELGEDLAENELPSEQLALLYYFLSNAWSDLRKIRSTESHVIWQWKQQEMEQEIIYLRKSIREKGFDRLDSLRKSQVFTNCGNILNSIGRFVEAIEYWDRALEETANFGMALGNKGYALSHYARALYDDGHKLLFLKYAHVYLKEALKTNLEEGAPEGFTECIKQIERVLATHYSKDIDLDSFSLGRSEKERRYRQWCLQNRLFLNPINDLGPYKIASRDIFSLPSMVVKKDEGSNPYYYGCFNLMKQEFVSARFLYYEGINQHKPHFSDKGVLLYNTLDYPAFSLSLEKVKVAYRVAYSLFDKIAFFLNHYLCLGIHEKRVNLRTCWYNKQNPESGLIQVFEQRQNWPLRGLFWLSRDLHYKEDLAQPIEPDAQELANIRNHLEHKYLKIHFLPQDGLIKGKPQQLPDDPIAVSLYRGDFEEKTLRILKLARAALIYLSLGVGREEDERAAKISPNSIIPPLLLDTYDDDWKH